MTVMKLGKTVYFTGREQWRSWLSKHYNTDKEIWLLYYKKHSGKPRLPYNDAVEEALCYGWIDSIVKKVDDESTAQRFSPRRKNSLLSEMNKERARRMIRAGKMTEAGLEKISGYLKEKFVFPSDIIREIKKNKLAWKNFCRFPKFYKTIRLGYIEGMRDRPIEFKKSLSNFIRMTEKNKKFGMVK